MDTNGYLQQISNQLGYIYAAQLFVIGCMAALFVCLILYYVLKIFMGRG